MQVERPSPASRGKRTDHRLMLFTPDASAASPHFIFPEKHMSNDQDDRVTRIEPFSELGSHRSVLAQSYQDLTHTLRGFTKPNSAPSQGIFSLTQTATSTSAFSPASLHLNPSSVAEGLTADRQDRSETDGAGGRSAQPDPLAQLWGSLNTILGQEVLPAPVHGPGFPLHLHRFESPSPPFLESSAIPLTTSVPLALTRTQQLFAQKMAAEEASAAENSNLDSNNDSNDRSSGSAGSNHTSAAEDAAKVAWAQSMPLDTIKSFEQLGNLATVLNRSFTASQSIFGPQKGVLENKMSSTETNNSPKSSAAGTTADAQASSSDPGGPPTMSPATYRSGTLEVGNAYASPSSSTSANSRQLPQYQQQQQTSQQRQMQGTGQQNFLQANQPYRRPTQQSLYFQQLIAAKLGQMTGSGSGIEPASGTRNDFGSELWTPDARQMDALPSSRSPLYAVSGGVGATTPSSAGSNVPAPYGSANETPYGYPSMRTDRGGEYPLYPAPLSTTQPQRPLPQQQQQHQDSPQPSQQLPPQGQYGPYPSSPSLPSGYSGWQHGFAGHYPGAAPGDQSAYRDLNGTEIVTDFWGRTVTRPAQQQPSRAYQEWGNAWSGGSQQQPQAVRPMSSGDASARGPTSSAGTPAPGQQGYQPMGSTTERRPPSVPPAMASSSRMPLGFATGSGGETMIVPDLTEAGMNSTPWSGTAPVVYGQSESSVGDRQGDQPRKATLACHFCRGRKLRCDGVQPTCAHCVKRGLSCSYDIIIRRRGPGRHKKADKVAAALAATEANGGIVPPEYESILNPATKQPRVNGQGPTGTVTGAKRGRKSKAEKAAAALAAGMNDLEDDGGVRDDGSVSGDDRGQGEGPLGDDGRHPDSGRSYHPGSGMDFAPLRSTGSSNSMHSGFSYPNPYQDHPYSHPANAGQPTAQQSQWNPYGSAYGGPGYSAGQDRQDALASSHLQSSGQSYPSGEYQSHQIQRPMSAGSASVSGQHPQHHYRSQKDSYSAHDQQRSPPHTSRGPGGQSGRARSPSEREYGDDEREIKRLRAI